jgi:hypothetical protein
LKPPAFASRPPAPQAASTAIMQQRRNRRM